MPEEDAAGRGGTVTRDLILRECARLFREQGFHATTMQDIANRVGILKGSLYYHVRSKEEILVDLLVGSVSDVHRAVTEAVEGPHPARSKLRLLITAELVAMARHQDEIIVWLTERWRGDVALEKVEQLAHAVDEMLRATLGHGAETGEWGAAHLDLAYQAIRGIVAWFPMWYRPSGKDDVLTIADHFSSYAEAILSGPPTRKRDERSELPLASD